LFSNWNRNPVIELFKGDFKELELLLCSMEKEFSSHKMRKNEIVLMHLKVFLMKSVRLSGNVMDLEYIKRKETISKFLGLVDESCSKNMPITYYSDKLNITSTYLNRLVNKVYGKSVSDFVNERIILEAKRIIRLSLKSIKEISFELGFEDPSYFSRFFKKHTKMSPLQYRKTNNV
jgi:AraC family transcriptional activator of pobA